MKAPRRLASFVLILGTCVLLAGGAACASGGAAFSQLVALFVGALAVAGMGSFVAGCRDKGAQIGRDSGTDSGGEGDAGFPPFLCGQGARLPGSPGTEAWVRCCISGQIRACPPPPPTVACNFGYMETYCPDGITCGQTWNDPCGTGNLDAGPSDSGAPDAGRDAELTDTTPTPDGAQDLAPDAAAPVDTALPADAAADAFPGCGMGSRPIDGGAPDGWLRCCMGTEVRWCPPQPPNVACNYGQGQTFCADGVTCGWQTMNPCGLADGGAPEVMP